MKKQKLRPLGKILLDLEPLLNELIDHDLQWSDVLFLIYGWLQVHAPDAQEIYVKDNSNPIFFYGAKENK